MTPDLQPVVSSLMSAQQRLVDVVRLIEPACWSEPSPNPGWTYKDVLAHLAFGDWVCQHFVGGLIETGGILDWPDTDVNEGRVAARRDRSVAELMQERAEDRRNTINLIEQLQPAHLKQLIDFPAMPEVGKIPFLRYLQGFPGHDFGHIMELEAMAS